MSIPSDKPKKAEVVPIGKPVMISCQATQGCFGRQALIISSFDLEGAFGYAGRRTRYRCLACGRVFVIRH